jgi:hypothetical protein
MTPSEIAAKLTSAQREALLECTPWDVHVRAVIAFDFCSSGFLQESTILDDAVELTPLGLAVRAHLEQANDPL